jgi:EpsI family protein
MADGALHLFEGWVIFLVCSGLLAAEMYLLARLSGKAFFDVFYAPSVTARPPKAQTERSVRYVPVVTCLLLLCAAGLTVSLLSSRSEITPDRARFAGFPARLGEWQGRTSLLDPQTESGLALDDYILSDYSRSDGKPVNLYVAYYSSQRKGESPHSPLVCLPGNGWQITNLDRTSYEGFGAEQPMNRVVIEQGSNRQIVYYWFDERGRKIANEYLAKWYLLTDAIFMNRTDGALVRLMTSVLPGELEHDADERLQAFMHDAVPSLEAYLPSDKSSQVKSALNKRQGSQS